MYEEYTVVNAEKFKELLNIDVAPIGLTVEKKQNRKGCSVHFIGSNDNLLSLCGVSDEGNIIEEHHVLGHGREKSVSDKLLQDLFNKGVIKPKHEFYNQDKDEQSEKVSKN